MIHGITGGGVMARKLVVQIIGCSLKVGICESWLIL